MANILYFNLTNVKEAKGGRPQTIMFKTGGLKPNGTIIKTLKDTMEKDGRELDHVHDVEFISGGKVDSVIGKWVIAAPEIVAQQYRIIDDKAWQFALEQYETYPAYQLQALDRLEYSEAHFASIAGLAVGDYVNIDTNGKFAKEGSGNAQNSAFRVVSIMDVTKPVILAANASKGHPAAFIPQLGKMIKLEVVR